MLQKMLYFAEFPFVTRGFRISKGADKGEWIYLVRFQVKFVAWNCSLGIFAVCATNARKKSGNNIGRIKNKSYFCDTKKPTHK